MLERPYKPRDSADLPQEAKPWLSDGRRRHPSPPLLPPSSAAAEAGNGGNVDRDLYNNLVELFPLVESLMHRRANSSFTRRASMVYTPAPSHSKKATESKGGRATQTISAKKRRDLDNTQRNNQNGSSDDLSLSSSRAVEAENILKDREELSMLREQVNDLQRKMLEKDEALKSAEIEINQMKGTHVSIDELKFQIAEKDALVKSINSQLNNAKITLADKQAALERLTWEAQMSNTKIEELQGDIVSLDYEIAALMQIYEQLYANNSVVYPNESLTCYHIEPLPLTNDVIDTEMEKMEEASTAYLAAVSAAKENPTEELLVAAAEARQRLHAILI